MGGTRKEKQTRMKHVLYSALEVNTETRKVKQQKLKHASLLALPASMATRKEKQMKVKRVKHVFQDNLQRNLELMFVSSVLEASMETKKVKRMRPRHAHLYAQEENTGIRKEKRRKLRHAPLLALPASME